MEAAINYLNAIINGAGEWDLIKSFSQNVLKFIESTPDKETRIKIIDFNISHCDSYTIEFREILNRVKEYSTK